MKASETMAHRHRLHQRLIEIDTGLNLVLGLSTSDEVVSKARKLLNTRARVCDELIHVGFTPWDVPDYINESKVR